MNWPKLKRDWTGASVVLNREITTYGGIVFTKGTKMEVESYHRGMKLRDRRRRSITRVPASDVTLLKLAK